MVVALAHAHVSLQSVVDQLDSDQWGSWMANIHRSFLFAIRERLSGTILFMGKMVDPTQ